MQFYWILDELGDIRRKQIMLDKKECLDILTKMFTDNINYPFDGTEEVSDFETFVKTVLIEADSLYTDEYHYREYPEFKDFLYTHHVDTLAYNVYTGDLC